MAAACGGWRPGKLPGVTTEWSGHTAAHVNNRPCYTHSLMGSSQQSQGHKFTLWVREGRLREVKRPPKATQPLKERAGLEPRSSVSHLPSSTGTTEGGGDKPWRLGAHGEVAIPPIRRGRVPQAPECTAKAKVGGRYQLAEPFRDKWAAPGDGEPSVKRGAEGCDAHMSE